MKNFSTYQNNQNLPIDFLGLYGRQQPQQRCKAMGALGLRVAAKRPQRGRNATRKSLV